MENILLLEIIFVIVWCFLCLTSIHTISKENGLSYIIKIVFASSPLLLSISFIITNNIFVSSTITVAFFYLTPYILLPKKPSSNTEEFDGSVKVLKTVHKLEDYITGDSIIDCTCSFIIAISTGFPLIFISNSSNITVYATYILTFLPLSILIFIIYDFRGSQYTDIKFENSEYKWINDGRLVNMKPENISDIEEKRFRINITKENGQEEQIWVRNPSDVSREITTRKI